MSKILSDVFAKASVDFITRIPSERDKFRVVPENGAKLRE